MVSATYLCGCREVASEWSAARRCPIHGEPPLSAVVFSEKAIDLKYGPRYEAPPSGGLLYPKIEGQSTGLMR
jgi:hypothetical protein